MALPTGWSWSDGGQLRGSAVGWTSPRWGAVGRLMIGSWTPVIVLGGGQHGECDARVASGEVEWQSGGWSASISRHSSCPGRMGSAQVQLDMRDPERRDWMSMGWIWTSSRCLRHQRVVGQDHMARPHRGLTGCWAISVDCGGCAVWCLAHGKDADDSALAGRRIDHRIPAGRRFWEVAWRRKDK